MIYSESNRGDFTKLSEALKLYGITDSVIDIAVEYLNPEKARDDSLLEKIPLHTYTSHWRSLDALEKAVKKEILSDKSGELLNRYIILGHAIYGANAERFIIAYNGAFRLRNSDIGVVENALSLRFGDKSKACTLAMITCSNMHPIINLDKYSVTPKVCVEAIEFANNNNRLISVLSAMALNQIPIPEKKGLFDRLFTPKEQKNEIVEKALVHVHELIDKNTIPFDELMVAVGEGAYFSEKCMAYFKKCTQFGTRIVATAIESVFNPSRIMNLMLDFPEIFDTVFINFLAKRIELDSIKEFLGKICVKYTDIYCTAMESQPDALPAKKMEDILRVNNPDYFIKQDSLKEKAQRRNAAKMAELFENHDRTDIKRYMMGEIPIEDIMPILNKGSKIPAYQVRSDYISAYDIDDFAERIITLLSVLFENSFYNIQSKNTELFVDILAKNLKDPDTFLNIVAKNISQLYHPETPLIDAYRAVSKYDEKIAECNISNLSAYARWIYIMALGHKNADKYKEKILSLSGDTSKKVKEALIIVISAQTGWEVSVVNLLNSKKIGMREIAVEVIRKKQDIEYYREELQKAFEKEKSDKIKTIIAELLNMDYTSPKKSSVVSLEADVITTLTKGAETKKVAWLFEQPYKPVHFNDGEEVPENHLKALVIVYSDMTSAEINSTAVSIAEKMNPEELGEFVLDVFGRWLSKGAPAKTKWVLWLCGRHGRSDMIKNLMHYIKEWSEHSRSAIAGEAVWALAINGSSKALMNVDAMARKFKNKQVRSSANTALQSVAEQLGITKEELADKIVPDMEFDDKMCRVFDYGQRKFNVYLTPKLEIEIYNGDKQIKSMPKPSTKDDKEIAEKSYNAFKEMKKQIKAVIESQKSRLEYVLMCDRKWTAEAWNNLFVKNPIMNCFAMGLVWGIYDNSGLVQSFRYMDDGSLTDIECNEFEIPENSQIGLVHPIELSDEQRNAWAEQLSDYEIKQPFAQIGRPFYKPDENEMVSDVITRFDGAEINGFSLLGKMQKFGWDKGMAQDAGFFYDFVRTDFSECVKNQDGTFTYTGMGAEIEFSGMDISMSYMDTENVTLKSLFFHPSGSCKKLMIKDVSPRYFSEIIMQISSFAVNNE